MQDFNDLYYFAKVVEHQGFAAASRALHLPRSKLSRRIKALEDRLGVRLLQRSTRSFSVTELGQKYYQYCRAMIVEAQAAQDFIALNHSEPCGTIKISSPPALLYYSVSEMLARFLLQYPKINIEMEATNRNVDVMTEGIDIALRVRFPPFPDSDVVIKPLAINTLCLVANPSLFKHRPPPQSPADLSGFNSIGLGNADMAHTWSLRHADSGMQVEVTHHPVFMVNDIISVLDAAKHGVGIAPVPRAMAHDYLESGQLIEVLPEWKPASAVILAAFSSRRGLLPSVRALLDFLAQGFQAAIDSKTGYEQASF